MSFKNKLRFGLVSQAMNQPGIHRLLKRLVILTVVVGTIFIISSAVLVGVCISQVNKLVANRSDSELAALNNLLSTNQIVLTQQQRTDIMPLVEQLAKEQSNTQQVEKIKAQILNNLDKQQLKSVQTWQQNTKSQSKEILSVGREVLAEKISTYTGMSAENSQRLLDSISAWIKLNPVTDNVTTSLQKQIEQNQ